MIKTVYGGEAIFCRLKKFIIDKHTIEKPQLFLKLRLKKVLPLLKGKTLDVGCCDNQLKNNSHNIIVGLDPMLTNKIDICGIGEELPFKSETFDTIVMSGVLNHVVKRDVCLQECYRVLTFTGTLIITCPGVIIGKIVHLMFPDVWEYKEGEIDGISSKLIINLLKQANFKNIKHSRFSFKLNNLYTCNK
jgi:SAM-dependent methyltransferase